MKTEIQPVSKAAADLFLRQCIGTYSGHMAEIAFSPTIKAIVESHGVNTWETKPSVTGFAEFLREVAEQLAPCNVCNGRGAVEPSLQSVVIGGE